MVAPSTSTLGWLGGAYASSNGRSLQPELPLRTSTDTSQIRVFLARIAYSDIYDPNNYEYFQSTADYQLWEILWRYPKMYITNSVIHQAI